MSESVVMGSHRCVVSPLLIGGLWSRMAHHTTWRQLPSKSSLIFDETSDTVIRQSTTNESCAVKDCDKEVTCRGWCHKPYIRWRRHGDPTKLGYSPLKNRRYINGLGYRIIRIAAGDRHAGMGFPSTETKRSIEIPEHRYVMARYLGRDLLRVETVHHINGHKADNRIENLQLRRGDHGQGIAYTCVNCGSDNIEAVELA